MVYETGVQCFNCMSFLSSIHHSHSQMKLEHGVWIQESSVRFTLVDTTHFKSEIWKYLLRVAVFFETIHHEGAARVVYGFKKYCYPRKIFPYFTSDECGI